MAMPRLLPGDRSAADPTRAVTLGVMGGGQLGRMFVHAAQQLGFRTVVLEPDAASPAGVVAHAHVNAGYLDEAGLQRLADEADAITTEFENVPAAALRTLAERRPVAPSGDAVAVCQDRAAEKAHFTDCGVPVAPYAVIDSDAALAAVGDDLLPGILKTARLGYDGKGQIRVADRAELAAGWTELGGAVCVLEKRLPLAFEVSVLIARGGDGRVVAFPLQQNLHRDGILAVTTVPAPAGSPALEAEAIGCAARIAADLGYVGVLCIEFFILEDGSLVANEMAPRPHNSGHHTDRLVRRVAVRPAGARDGRPAAGQAAAALAAGDAEPARRPVVRRAGGRALAGLGGRAGAAGGAPAPLRQGVRPPRSQDGPPDAHGRDARGGA